jgi:AmmeMemoRadiSam system protein B
MLMRVREPAVAGQFYARDAGELEATVATLLDEAPQLQTPAPKALIVPHAGYIYSGPVAATAYAQLRPYRDRYRRIVLLGPCHCVPLAGAATCSTDIFRMPCGDIPLDTQTIAALQVPGLEISDRAHRFEHSLEVHLPFLQAVLGEFYLIPIVIGDAARELVDQVFEALWDGPGTLIVVSSDLSHYLPYDDARRTDAVTRAAIECLQDDTLTHDMACGAAPIAGLLRAARRHHLAVTTLDLRNSGDTNGDRDAVVGYGAWMFS